MTGFDLPAHTRSHTICSSSSAMKPVFLTRGQSHRGRGLNIRSVEVLTRTTKVRGFAPRVSRKAIEKPRYERVSKNNSVRIGQSRPTIIG